MTIHAQGPFEVRVLPQPPEDENDPNRGRMLLDKQYHGALEATAKGQMLTGMSEVKGSGAYVAIERVTGALHGREGSFLLYHVGTMERGVPHLTITVVPDSGTRGLVGLKGTMTITIAEGKHDYDFTYSVGEA
jgi:uncharacterized protein DUF3224